MKKKIHLVSHFLGVVTAKEITAFILIVVVSISYIPIPIIIRDILKELQAYTIDLNQMINYSAVLVAIFLLQVTIILFSRKVLVHYIRSSVQKLRENLLIKYLYSANHLASETISTVHKKVYTDTEMVDRFFNSLLTNILPAGCISLIAFSMMIYINFFLMIWVAGLSLLILITIKVFKRKRDSITSDYFRKYSKFNKMVLFILRFRDVIYTQGMRNEEHKTIKNNLESLKSEGVRMEMAYTRTTGIQELGQSTLLVIILLVAAFMKNQGRIEIEAVFAMFFLIYVVRRQFLLISLHAQNITEGYISLNKLKELEDKLSPSEVDEKVKLAHEITFDGSLEFDAVSFSYNSRFKLIENVSFSLLPHRINLLQGANGVGKSTIMRLILGHMRPDSGSIRIEGVDNKELNYESFIDQTSVVLQENELFEGTIKDNLLYGVLASQNKIADVLEQVGLKDWVNQLPLKLDTSVSDLTSKISGGEKQRLVIARAILREPRFIILDEPTNHLDTQFIKKMTSTFAGLKKQTTFLIISHDKSLEEIADQIMLLEDFHVKIR